MKTLINILALLLMSTNVNALPSEKSNFALEKLNEWNSQLSKKGVLAHGMMIDSQFTEVTDLNQSFGIDKRYNGKDRFFKFARDEYGAVLYLWYYPELKGEPPVVLSDVSDDAADSVTENITDYVCSLIQGGDDIYKKNASSLEEVEAYKKQLLKSLDCKAKPKVFFGLEKHPKFDEWLDKLDDLYQEK